MTQAELVDKVASMWLKTEVLSNCHQAAEELIAVARPIIEANLLRDMIEKLGIFSDGTSIKIRNYARERGLEIGK